MTRGKRCTIELGIVLLLTFLSSCSSNTQQPFREPIGFTSRFASVIDRHASSKKSLISRDAKQAYKEYFAEPGYKAFAQAENGAFGAVTGYYTTISAAEEALRLCASSNKNNTLFPCKLINANNHWASEF